LKAFFAWEERDLLEAAGEEGGTFRLWDMRVVTVCLLAGERRKEGRGGEGRYRRCGRARLTRL
jgi:hypothetical protein